MNLLVFGQTGQVARELQRLAPEARFLSRTDADLSNAASCAAAIETLRPAAVINAAAYTAVDRAESERALAFAINADAPTAMAEAAAQVGAVFVHISTDYVFDGSGHVAWDPGARTDPVNAYGASKLSGEDGVRSSKATHAILRTSWVFSAHGQNFVKTMLRLGETRADLKVVDDQFGGPTPAAAIADACLKIASQLQADTGKSGTYHFSGAPDVSWKDFATEIFDQIGQGPKIAGILTKDYPTPARRPLNSRLECRFTEATFGLPRPDWKAGLRQVLRDLGKLS